MAKIEEKIIKLLELAKSPNMNEAFEAAKKAQELMAKHNISMQNLKSANNQKSVNGVTESYGKSYRFRLAKIVADNYGVKNYYINKMTVAFFGNPVNVDTAVRVYDYLHNVIHRLADSHQTKVWKATKNTKGVYNSFVAGFLDGLKQELDAQCTTLKIVVPEKVENDYKVFAKDFTSFKSKGLTVAGGMNFDAYKAGVEKAKEVSSAKQLEG